MKTLKKLLATVTVLGMLAPLFCLHTMEAAMAYPVWVGGVQVTGANMDDVLGDGTVSYRYGRLTLRDAARGLSTGERKMLHSARQILISELVLSKSQSYESVSKELDTALA